MENQEQEQDQVVDKSVEDVEKEVMGDGEQAPADRPLKNWQMEQARKERESEALRQEVEKLKSQSVAKRDPNDLKTWADHELKAIKYSNDSTMGQLKDEAEEILMERKFERLREKERSNEKRTQADIELRKSFPEASDPTSELYHKMEEVMYKFDLQKSPAGRLAAAKLAAVELGQGVSKSEAKARKAEADRVARVKGQMVDGDRAKPAENPGNDKKKLEDTMNKVNSKNIEEKALGVGELLKNKGIDFNTFFNR